MHKILSFCGISTCIKEPCILFQIAYFIKICAEISLCLTPWDEESNLPIPCDFSSFVIFILVKTKKIVTN